MSFSCYANKAPLRTAFCAELPQNHLCPSEIYAFSPSIRWVEICHNESHWRIVSIHLQWKALFGFRNSLTTERSEVVPFFRAVRAKKTGREAIPKGGRSPPGREATPQGRGAKPLPSMGCEATPILLGSCPPFVSFHR